MEKLPEHIEWLKQNWGEALLARLTWEGEYRPEQDGDSQIFLYKALSTFIAADPSRNKGAVDWLVKCYCGFDSNRSESNFLWEDVRDGVNSKAFETLQLFARYRKNLSGNNRSLSNYKRLGDVWNAVVPFVLAEQEVEDKPGVRSLRREERERALEQSLVLFRSEKLIVSTPLTKEASQWWGRGTRWCTASTESTNYFDHYNKNSPLIVITFPQGLEDEKRCIKFQLWATEGEQAQFMDEADNRVEPTDLARFWHNFEPFVKWAWDKNPSNICFFPPAMISEEMKYQTLERNMLSFVHFPKETLNQEICKMVFDKFPGLIEYIPEEFIDQEMAVAAVKHRIVLFRHIPDRYRTEEDFIKFISQPQIFEYWLADPELERFWQEESICMRAIENSSKAFATIPERYLTDTLLMRAIELWKIDFYLIPEHLRNRQITEHCVKNSERSITPRFWDRELAFIALENPNCLKIVPHELQTEEWQLALLDRGKLCRTDNGMLGFNLSTVRKLNNEQKMRALFGWSGSELYFDERSIELDLWPKLALKEDFYLCAAPREMRADLFRITPNKNLDNFHSIPKSELNQELCNLALSHSVELLPLVPKNLIDEEMCLLVSRSRNVEFSAIPEQYITPEICQNYIGSGGSLEYVPENHRSVELCKLAISNSPIELRWMPLDLINEHMITLARKAEYASFIFAPKEFWPSDWDRNKLRESIARMGLNKSEILSNLPQGLGSVAFDIMDKYRSLEKHFPESTRVSWREMKNIEENEQEQSHVAKWQAGYLDGLSQNLNSHYSGVSNVTQMKAEHSLRT